MDGVPGYLPGTERGIRRDHPPRSEMLYAYSEATVPLITVVLRKATEGVPRHVQQGDGF
ncbi:hypothetical protein MASR1M66_15660 [Aminivibrio sp.]